MKVQKTITIDEKLANFIDEKAEKENRSFSNALEVILQKALEKNES